MRMIRPEQLKHLRETYPVGTRVELLQMDDVQAPPIGTKGTVTGIDDTGSLLVDWDNGSGLNVIWGVDVVRKVASGKPEQRWIPCDKGEPDEDTECWVTVKTTDTLYRGNFTKRYGERRDKGFITSGGFIWWNTALAWMPLPEPYKAESEG